MSLAIECESCGRPMASKEDHGGQNPDNPYCIQCTDLKGKLVPFEKKFEDMVNSATQIRWMNHEQAEKYALDQMSKMPAWKESVEQVRQAQSSAVKA